MYLELFEKLEIPYAAVAEFNAMRGCSWKFIDENKKIKSIPNKRSIYVPLILEEHELEFYASKLYGSLNHCLSFNNNYRFVCLCRGLEYGLFVSKGRNGLYTP